jgi:signal peptidase II
MTTSARRALAFLLVVGCVAFDQGSKRLAAATLRGREPIEFLGGTVRLAYAENTGAFGSLGASWPAPARQALFIAAPLLVFAVALVRVLRRPRAGAAEVTGWALLAGGGLGNLVDRVLRGPVVDFLWLGRGWLATNVFNVADLAIVAGVVLLALPARRAGKATAPPP